MRGTQTRLLWDTQGVSYSVCPCWSWETEALQSGRGGEAVRYHLCLGVLAEARLQVPGIWRASLCALLNPWGPQ